MRVLSLYTGMGGFDLACKQVLETKAALYVEKDSYCQKILQARIKDGFLDDAPIWPDVFTLPCTELTGMVDLIIGGFPCQPFSVAGRRKGQRDERNLWPITAKVIGEIRPPFVLLENVSGLASPLNGEPPYVLTVLGDLAQMGYDAVWGIVGARDAGAPHKRDRWWCLAYSMGDGSGHLPNFFGRAWLQSDSQRRQGMGDELSYRGFNMDDANGNPGRDEDPSRWQLQARTKNAGPNVGNSNPQGLPDRGAESARELPAWPPGPKDTDAWTRVLTEWPELAPSIDGKLSPLMVEWLMGLPLLHTEVDNEQTDSSQTGSKSPSISGKMRGMRKTRRETKSSSSQLQQTISDEGFMPDLSCESRPAHRIAASKETASLYRLRGAIPLQALQTADLCEAGVPENTWPEKCREPLERARQSKDLSCMWYSILAEAEKRYGLREAGMYLRVEIRRRFAEAQSKNRISRLKALGNAIVPAQGALALRKLLEAKRP